MHYRSSCAASTALHTLKKTQCMHQNTIGNTCSKSLTLAVKKAVYVVRYEPATLEYVKSTFYTTLVQKRKADHTKHTEHYLADGSSSSSAQSYFEATTSLTREGEVSGVDVQGRSVRDAGSVLAALLSLTAAEPHHQRQHGGDEQQQHHDAEDGAR